MNDSSCSFNLTVSYLMEIVKLPAFNGEKRLYLARETSVN